MPSRGAEGRVFVTEKDFPYRSLSSVARVLLPRAKELHGGGMSWRSVARHLGVSSAALFIWRRLDEENQAAGKNAPSHANVR